MKFISNGDFILPLHFPMYLAQHIYIWSYERGATNPDGILRLPGRLIDIAVFALVGNIGFGYFYLASCLLVAFISFWWFARNFLEANRVGVALIGALFFTFNPIFLGNLSKVGLILAASMLPLALTALKQGFQEKRFSYFVLFILAMNISLLHPFIFSINLIVSLFYAIVLAREQLAYIRDNTWKFLLLGIVGLLLNSYFILPFYSLRTLDKGSMSAAVSSAPTDYTSLVDIANTGDILTGMSLSKGVLKDYEFYGSMTWPFYFLGVLLLYVLLFGVYISIEKRIKPHERRRFVLALSIFLVLLVLATASYLYADVLIKLLIGLPGGWIFRSPLKWQLYMPLVLFTALVIVLKNMQDKQRTRLLYGALACCFLLMNGYLFKQIYQRLLTPRSLTYFNELEQTPLEHKSLLFVDSVVCFSYAQETPALATELNEVLLSKPVQVKHIQAGDLDTVNIGQYDFVMGCGGALDDSLLTRSYNFKSKAVFASGKYRLYENQQPVPYVGAVPQVFALNEPKEIGGKYALAKSLGQPFNFLTDSQSGLPAVAVQDLFENLSPNHIVSNQINRSFTTTGSGQQLLIEEGEPLFFAHKENSLEFSTVQPPDMQPAPRTISWDRQGTLSKITYFDPTYTYPNLISNPSLENGNWQKVVGDCNAYDKKPNLSMRLNQQTKTDGLVSLEMVAKAHIACTGPDRLPIQSGQHYLLSFDYRSEGERHAGYYVSFDDLIATSTNARLPSTEGKWQSFNTQITAPPGARHLRLLIYAYPNKTLHTTGIAGYDNFKLIPIPKVIGRFFIVNEQQLNAQQTPGIEFAKLNPTKTQISIKNAQEPFYLTTRESYHNLWKLSSSGFQVPNHLRLNASMNGWYIDPPNICSMIRCIRNGDGSYDFALTMEFTPQRWFYIGSLISGTTAALALIFVVCDLWLARRAR